MPKLRAKYAKKDEIPENFRDFYTENDGSFVLDVDPVDGFSLEDVSGLKSALGAERTNVEKLRGDLKAFEGLDPKSARSALKKVKELGDLDPAREADRLASEKFEAAKGQLVQQHESTLAERDAMIGVLSKNLDKFARSERARAAISAAGGNVKLLLPHVLDQLKLEEKDGVYDVRVVDANGNQRIADGKGTAMSIDGLLAEMRNATEFAGAFKTDKPSGSGIPNGSGGTGGTGTPGRYNMDASDAEKQAEINRRLGISA